MRGQLEALTDSLVERLQPDGRSQGRHAVLRLAEQFDVVRRELTDGAVGVTREVFADETQDTGNVVLRNGEREIELAHVAPRRRYSPATSGVGGRFPRGLDRGINRGHDHGC